jgi:hypothetical protein
MLLATDLAPLQAASIVMLTLGEPLKRNELYINCINVFPKYEIIHFIPANNDAYQANFIPIIVLDGKSKYSLYNQNPLVMLFRWPLS